MKQSLVGILGIEISKCWQFALWRAGISRQTSEQFETTTRFHNLQTKVCVSGIANLIFWEQSLTVGKPGSSIDVVDMQSTRANSCARNLSAKWKETLSIWWRNRVFRAAIDHFCVVIVAGIVVSIFYLNSELLIPTSHAQSLTSGSDSNSKKKSTLTNELAPGVFYEGYLESTLEFEDNFDLDKSNDDDVAALKHRLGLSLLIDPGEWYRLFFETEISREDLKKNQRGKSTDGWEWRIKQAFVDFPNVSDGATLRVGRQNFKDPMEWFYDANLDGARIYYNYNDFSFEASVSREHLLPIDQLNNDKKNEIDNYIAVASYAPNKKSSTSGYVIYRDEDVFNNNNPEDLLFFGIQSIGQFSSAFEYWLNAAYVTGERARAAGARPIEAYAVDAGATLIFDDAPLEPSFTVGFVHGSGDSRRNSGKDTNFRQTGLQDNNYRFNGVTKFKYLGELFDPEITNIDILTLGAGIRPTKKSSIDIVYHHYRQDKAVDRLSGTNLNLDPLGIDKNLGHEWDVIFGVRASKNLSIEAVFGGFFPGAAFASNADNAWFGKLEINTEF